MANSDVLIRKFIFDLEIDKQESFSFYNESLSNFVKERSEEIFQDILNSKNYSRLISYFQQS